jgi:hypothetical protein
MDARFDSDIQAYRRHVTIRRMYTHTLADTHVTCIFQVRLRFFLSLRPCLQLFHYSCLVRMVSERLEIEQQSDTYHFSQKNIGYI